MSSKIVMLEIAFLFFLIILVLHMENIRNYREGIQIFHISILYGHCGSYTKGKFHQCLKYIFMSFSKHYWNYKIYVIV